VILYLVFLGSLAGLRIWELARSKRSWATHRDYATMPSERLFPWMVALHSSFFVLLPLELLLRRPEWGGPVSWTAMIVTALALALRFWTLATLGRSWNVRIISGRDYPIVSSGPYRYIRHPNYVVVFIELLAIPMIYHLTISAMILTLGNLAVLSIRIRNEEAVLRENPAWLAEMADKPRFIPFLF